MKKVILLSCLLGAAFVSNAQLTLYGASPYTQNFNTVGTGLPTGWVVYSGATASILGDNVGNYSNATSDGVFRDSTCGNITGGFKNYPSANDATMIGASCTAEQAATDRALGVRQVSPTNATNPNLDSGADFVLQLANTSNMTNVGCTFKLQSLDTSSSRTTTWRLQYRIGGTGAFTQITPTAGTMTTGGHIFSNSTINASFGTALNNLSSTVYIRIVTLDFSTGSGNRASTAIDDFNLTWTGTAGINDVTGNATLPFGVTSASTSNIGFNFDAEEAGNYSLVITDMVGRTVHTQQIDAVHGNQNISATGLSLAPGMYVAKLTNGKASGITKVMIN